VRVKICGITSVADAAAVVQAGADAIGLNLYAGPRKIDTGTAASILESLPPMVSPVALVELHEGRLADHLVSLLARYQVSLLQVYGGVTADAVVRLDMGGFTAIPVVSVRDAGFAAMSPVWKGTTEWRPRAVLLDAYDREQRGGTGMTFRWDWVREAREAGRLNGWPPIILAGGLNPDNVGEAIRIARPYAVDVSSGVEIEGASGKKDPAKVRAFVRQAKAAFERNSE
jgi:phosphoribosylanthranilate isomerase